MNAPTAKLTVLVGERFACVKVVGRANFNAAVDFKNALAGLEQRGFSYLVIELSECPLMDSTFLGVLAASALRHCPEAPRAAIGVVEIRNANERLLELLENLGVLHLFKTCNDALPDCKPEARHPTECSRAELTEASLEAHRTLAAINPENAARFKDVTQFLTEDLARLKKSPAAN
jgi:anti-anti-sigma regulatory factor